MKETASQRNTSRSYLCTSESLFRFCSFRPPREATYRLDVKTTKTGVFDLACGTMNILVVVFLTGSVATSSFPANGTISLGFMGFDGWGPPFQFSRLGSAFSIALDEIHGNESILVNHSLTFHIMDDGCSTKKALDTFVTVVKQERCVAVIGPVCSSASKQTAYLASYWNLPMIAYGGSDVELSNKKVRSCHFEQIEW